MPFAAALRKSLQDRGSDVPAEFKRGDSLEDVLNRHLMTVEQMGGDDVFTCILLLSPDGKRLSLVPLRPFQRPIAVPVTALRLACRMGLAQQRLTSVVPSIRSTSRRTQYGGTSATSHLQHGYRSCWSTPIRNSNGAIIGTFAILHRTVGMPTHEEIEAIELITGHVAEAIMCFRDPKFLR